MRASHFNNGKLGHGDDREINVGETLMVDCEPELCKQGLHGSVHPFDALQYVQYGHINLDFVEIAGEIAEGKDKVVGKARRVIKRLSGARLRKLLAQFAGECAERARKHADGCVSWVVDAARHAVSNAHIASCARDTSRVIMATAWAAWAAQGATWTSEEQWQRDRFLELIEKEIHEEA